MTKVMLVGLLFLASACQPLPGTSDSPSATPGDTQTATPTSTTKTKHAQGVLVAIRTQKHGDHDSVEFEFGGAQPPPERHRYETEIRFDPSDQPVPLQGKAFLRVVFDGAALDNLAYENDPAKQEKYSGPTRVAPGLPVVKELAVAGNFENVLSFGIGLDRQVRVTVENGGDPARVTVNLWYQ
jgi:hypothetical protein